MWVNFKTGAKAWGTPQWLPIEEADLLKYRLVVKDAFGLVKEPEMGFVPLTFALDKAGLAGLPKFTGADKMLIGYALYQTIRIYSGTWEAGCNDAKFRRLNAVYAKD